MRQWFFDNIPAFEPHTGFQTRFLVQTPEREFLHVWRLIEVIPRQKLVYHWTYGGYTGESFVTFELFGQDNSTLLRLTHDGVASFPQDVPEFSPQSCRAGWTYFIQQSLLNYLQSREI